MPATTDVQPQLPSCEHTPRAYDGPSKADVLAMRKQYLTPALITMYSNPVMIVEGVVASTAGSSSSSSLLVTTGLFELT